MSLRCFWVGHEASCKRSRDTLHKFNEMWSPRSLLILCSCVAHGSAIAFPTWCVVPSTVRVLQNESCDTYKAVSTDTVAWYAMRGEQESKQVLLDLGSWPSTLNLTSSVSIAYSDLQEAGGDEAIIPRTAMAWWQVAYVFCNPTTRYPGSGGGWRPDPILNPPAGNESVLLETGVTQPLWLGITVPYGTTAGQYAGSLTLTVKLDDGTTLAQTINIELNVWNIDLPRLREAQFPAIFSFNFNNLGAVYPSVSDDLKKAFFDILTDQRIGGNNLYSPTPANVSDSLYLAEAGNQWLTIFNVDAAVGVRTAAPYRPGKPKDSCINFTDALVVEVLTALVPVVKEHQDKGILQNMFVYGFDEVGPDCAQSMRNVFGAIKEVWPELRTVAAINWVPPVDLPLDVWVLQYEEYDPAQAQDWIAAGKQQWWYHCIEPSGIDYLNTFIERPLLEARLLYWYGSGEQVGGWLFWSDVLWQRVPASRSPISRLEGTARTDFDPANYVWYPRTDIFANGDGNLLYPGDDGPVSSVRLHNIRDGFEDAELLRMLDLQSVQQLVAPLVRSPTDYTLDPLLLEQQRLQAAAKVLQ